MGEIKDSEARVTDATAERQWVAKQIEERNKKPLNVAIRPGGYFLSSAGIPTDAEGRRIPEAEWLPEDRARLLGAATGPEAPKLPEGETALAQGADKVETSGSERRDPRRRAQQPR